MSYRALGVGPEVVRRLKAGDSYGDIAAALECATATVAYHAKKHGLTRGGSPVQSLRADVDWTAIQVFYDAGHGVRACCTQFGISNGSWGTAVKHGDVVPRAPTRQKPLETYLVANSTLHHKARRRLVSARGNHCEVCGLTDWLDDALALDVHHRNGDRRDNRADNLQILCPNCHRQQGPLV